MVAENQYICSNLYIDLRNHFHLNLLLLKLILAITQLRVRNISAGILAFNPAHIRKSVWGQEPCFLIVLLSAPECDMLSTQCPIQTEDNLAIAFHCPVPAQRFCLCPICSLISILTCVYPIFLSF